MIIKITIDTHLAFVSGGINPDIKDLLSIKDLKSWINQMRFGEESAAVTNVWNFHIIQ